MYASTYYATCVCIITQDVEVNHIIISYSKPSTLNKLFPFNYIVLCNQICTQEAESKHLLM